MPTKTTALTEFDRTSLRMLMDEAEPVLKAIAEKHGIVLSRIRKGYRKNALPLMFEFIIREENESGEVLSRDAIEFKKYATVFGLKPEDLGRRFESRGETYEICGASIKSSKYPILAKNISNGKVFKFMPESILPKLAAAKAA
jgi:hypothetical protein